MIRMLKLFAFLISFAFLFSAHQSLTAAEPKVVDLWPMGLPKDAKAISAENATELKKKTTEERIAFVDKPTLHIYQPPKEKRNGCAVVVCPGGGYHILAWPKEGVEVAEWLNSLGVTVGVLQYRVPRRDPEQPHHEPLQDVQRAVRVMRTEYEKWEIDPLRIGVLGFSAGGHLAVMAATHWDQPAYEPKLRSDLRSCRPDFVIPIYAAYLGSKADPYVLDPQIKITKHTPPAFMAVTLDDQLRGAQAALLLIAYKKAKVDAELHVYQKGGHGYGLRKSDDPVHQWPELCADWLRTRGLLTKPEPKKRR